MAKGKKTKKIKLAPWRPNFRNTETLPDTKVIRTDFLLNFVSISVAIGLLFIFAYKEYNSYSVKAALDTLERQISDGQSENRRLMGLNGRFKRSEKTLEQVLSFTKQPLLLSEFLKTVGEIRPESIILSNLSYRPVVITQGRKSTVDYRVVITGTLSDQAQPSPTQIITEFQRQLSESDKIAPYFKDIALSRFVRDSTLGIFNFTIEISLNPEEVKDEAR